MAITAYEENSTVHIDWIDEDDLHTEGLSIPKEQLANTAMSVSSLENTFKYLGLKILVSP